MSLSTVLRTEHGRSAVVELPRLALVILSGDQKGQEHVVSGDVCRIGKTDDNDLVIRDQTVSRAHCELVRRDGELKLVDMSRFGTFVNEKRVSGEVARPRRLWTRSTITYSGPSAGRAGRHF